MADINSSLDEILTELGDGYDAEIAPRRIFRSTANKIWLMLRAFARGLYGLYQVVAALRWRFDPLYCTDEELESTMRIVGTERIPGKATLLTVIINNTGSEAVDLIGGTPDNTTDPPSGTPDGGFTRYLFTSANGVTFAFDNFETITIQPGEFATVDFYSILGDAPYIGAFPVSDNSNITVTREDATPINIDIAFDCEDNSNQLGSVEETMFEARQRILTGNQRQELLYILEERLKALPNIHEVTVLYNNSLFPATVPYPDDSGQYNLTIPPQAIFVILTGSPDATFAKEFVSLCPFITVDPNVGQTPPLLAAAENWVTYFPSPIYLGGKFPIYYVKHIVKTFDVIIEYGYSSSSLDVSVVEQNLRDLLRSFQTSSTWKELVKVEDYFLALSAYQNPGLRILAIVFKYNNEYRSYITFEKTQLARLAGIGFQATTLWETEF